MAQMYPTSACARSRSVNFPVSGVAPEEIYVPKRQGPMQRRDMPSRTHPRLPPRSGITARETGSGFRS